MATTRARTAANRKQYMEAYKVGGKTYYRRKASTYHGKPGVHGRGRNAIPTAARRDAWGGRFTHK